MLLPSLTIAQRGGKGGYGGDFSGFGSKKKSSYFRGNVSGKIVDSNTGEGLEYANISTVQFIRKYFTSKIETAFKIFCLLPDALKHLKTPKISECDYLYVQSIF